MTHSFLARGVALVIFAVSVSACTMKDQERPSLTGPSEFAKAISISVSPDVLQQDGRSQSIVTITARGVNGEPLPGVDLRAEIQVSGTPTDFGKLSATSLRTGSDGSARLTYTAPLGSSFVLEESTMVNIAVTPTESDFGNSSARLVSLRLVAIGIVLPPVEPGTFAANFTFSPTAPTAEQTVFFDASASRTPPSNPITTYSWDFGDGERGTGRTTTHSYDEAGNYVVTLTISDALGRSAVSEPVTVTVAPPADASPEFTFSPIAPRPTDTVFFNASQSTPGPGRRIVSYAWDFGDGTPASTGVQTSHRFGREATFTVTLTVTDDLGRKFVLPKEVPVEIP
jgi:PKD repeat protein